MKQNDHLIPITLVGIVCAAGAIKLFLMDHNWQGCLLLVMVFVCVLVLTPITPKEKSNGSIIP